MKNTNETIMNIKSKLFLIILFTFSMSFSQEKGEVLLTIDGAPVMASEFLNVYNKNLDLVKDESQKDIDGYLELFIEYQLKLKEAKRLKMHESGKYLREFSSYKKQLIEKYLTENKVTNKLVKEAYNRSKQDINASHALVILNQTEKDTLKAYNEILALRKRIITDGFEAVKSSEHNGKTVFVEDLGYFSAFKMVYDFETIAYNTPVGKISMPFRTQFGYHVLKVNNKRPSKGTIAVAHIMIVLQQKDSLIIPKKRINDIHQKINEGENFEALAKQFSDDKSSAKDGGKIKAFKSGQLSSIKFEDEAFSLKNNGDISKPFKTRFGWHIVKRINLKPIKPFEDLKPTLENNIKRDSRSQMINKAIVNELTKRYQVISNAEAKSYFESIITDNFFLGEWKLPEAFKKDKTILTINNKSFAYEEFGKHIINAQRTYYGKKLPISYIVNKEYNAFFEQTILKYREDNLESENEEFADIISEYRNGLLLFDLMEKEVWKKASKDTIGLKTYYNKNKSNYKWLDRIDIVMASSADKKTMKKFLEIAKKTSKMPDSNFNETSKLTGKEKVIFTRGIFNTNANKLPSKFVIKKGISKLYKHNETFHIIDVTDILPARLKTFNEAKGAIISDYQTETEKKWIKDLHNRFTVKVNRNVLETIKAKIKN